jgi:hypothetical protein
LLGWLQFFSFKAKPYTGLIAVHNDLTSTWSSAGSGLVRLSTTWGAAPTPEKITPFILSVGVLEE